MTLSPVVTQSVADEAQSIAPKRSLAVRSSSRSKGRTEARPSAQVEVSELAEQLNEDTKQKYVKGTSSTLQVTPYGSQVFVRQEAW